jgi:hypothetical protein
MAMVFALAVVTSIALVLAIQPTRTTAASSCGLENDTDALKADIASLKKEIANIKGKLTNPVYRAGARTGNELSGIAPSKDSKPRPNAQVIPNAIEGNTQLKPLQFTGQTEEEMRAEKRRIWDEQGAEMMARTEEWLDNVYSERLEKYSEELQLTSNQYYSVRSAFDARKNQILIIYEQTLKDEIPADERVKWEDVDKRFQYEIAQILTPGQLQTYNEKGLGNFSGLGMSSWPGGRYGRRQKDTN